MSSITIVYTATSNQDFQRLADFLNDVAPHKLLDAMTTIYEHIDCLLTMPMLGKALPNEHLPNLRKLTIPFGKSGYILLYSFDANLNLVVIETLRHMKELEPKFLKNLD